MIKKLKRYTKANAPNVILRLLIKPAKKIKTLAFLLINIMYAYIIFPIDFLNFKKKSRENKRFEMRWKDRYPRLGDKTKQTLFDRHYVYHTAWAARKVNEIDTNYHVDISSSLYFSSIVSAFLPVKFYDYRPADLKLSNLSSEHIDLTNLRFKSNSVKSLSCMHTIEHVGLGRYGDPIDPDGDVKAINELKRVLAPGGNLLFVVPIGYRAVVMFNAHRIYTVSQILEYFKDLALKEFVLIPEKGEDGGLVKNPSPELLRKQKYACGCFWFKKL